MEYRNLILEYMKRVEEEIVYIKDETDKSLEIIQQEKVSVMNEGEAKLNAARHTINTLSEILSEMESKPTNGIKSNNMADVEYREYVKTNKFREWIK